MLQPFRRSWAKVYVAPPPTIVRLLHGLKARFAQVDLGAWAWAQKTWGTLLSPLRMNACFGDKPRWNYMLIIFADTKRVHETPLSLVRRYNKQYVVLTCVEGGPLLAGELDSCSRVLASFCLVQSTQEGVSRYLFC